MNFCFYCLQMGLERAKVAVVHDKRGCHAVCADHERWRKTTSYVAGHGEGCPERRIVEKT